MIVPGEDRLAVLDGELSAHRDDEVAHALLLPALLLQDLDVRVQLLLAVFDDDALTQTGELVELLGHRLVLDDVDEPDRSVDVGDDRVRVRIPGEDHLVLFTSVAVLRPSGSRRAAPAGARAIAAFLSSERLDENLAFVRRDDALSFAVRDDDETIAVLDAYPPPSTCAPSARRYEPPFHRCGRYAA